MLTVKVVIDDSVFTNGSTASFKALYKTGSMLVRWGRRNNTKVRFIVRKDALELMWFYYRPDKNVARMSRVAKYGGIDF